MSAPRTFGVIGRNITYSKSKVIFEAAFAPGGIVGAFEIISSEPSDLPRHLERVRSGGLIIVRDSHERENEGDIVFAAEHVEPSKIAFMAVQARGLICQAVTEDTASRLGLHPMVPRNNENNATAFTVSVDAIEGTTTGISAADRANTVTVITNPESRPSDLCRPGHLFPLIAREGGVFSRPGHTEAAVDLARLAGVKGIRARLYVDAGLDTWDRIATHSVDEMRDITSRFIEETGFPGVPPTSKEALYTIENAKKMPRTVEW